MNMYTLQPYLQCVLDSNKGKSNSDETELETLNKPYIVFKKNYYFEHLLQKYT